jgi:hypothetical protein
MTFQNKGEGKDKKLVPKDAKPKKPEKFSKPICIKFLCNGKKIANDYYFTGKLEDALTVDNLPKIPDGFKLPDNFKVNMKLTEQKQTLVLKCLRDVVTYKIIPTDNKGNVIDSNMVKTHKGIVGTEISISQMPKVEGYHLYQSRSYFVPKGGKNVNVVYGPSDQKIQVVYQTNVGENLADSYVSGKTGTTYDLHPERQSFTGYELDEDSKKLIHGSFNGKVHKIELKYKPIKCTVKVSYVDESGNAIHDPLILPGHYKEPYFIKLPTNDGYEYAGLTEELSRVFTKAKDEVVLRFKRATVSFKVNLWFDENHTQSAGDSLTISGLVGNLYSKKVPVIDGYKPNAELIHGRFNPIKNPDIDVVYSKIKCTLTVLLEDETGRLLSKNNSLLKPIIKNGNWGEKYKIALPDIDGFIKPKKIIEGKFSVPTQNIEINYQAKEVLLTVNYIDSRSKKQVANYKPDVSKVLAGSSYAAEPLNIDGFLLKEMPDNANGVVGAEPIIVNFMYVPKKSTIIIHYNDQNLTSLGKDDKIFGHFGESYNITPKQFAGFKFSKASTALKSTYPAGRLDIYLEYEAQEINFSLVPVNQYGDEINKYYNQYVGGLVKQTFSIQMPEIPGFELEKHIINGQILSEYNKKVFPIAYRPKNSFLIVHTLIKGGNKDGQQPIKDETLQGKTDQRYNYSIKPLTGYHTEQKELNGRFTANTQDLTIIYLVNRDNYQIEFVCKGKKVGEMPENEGYFDQGIDVEKSIPNGYHLPDGLTDAQVRLNGSKNYKVNVLPKTIMIDLVAETEDGMALEKTREVPGFFKEKQEVHVPIVDGYQPVNGRTIKLDFDLEKGNREIIPIKYKAEPRKITVKYISTRGLEIAHKEEVNGFYNDPYEIKPKEIRGYFAIDTSPRRGTFGLQNTEIAFVYREGSDKFSKATASFDDILEQQSDPQKDDDSQIVHNHGNQQVTEAYLNNDFDQNETISSNDQTVSANNYNQSNKQKSSSSVAKNNIVNSFGLNPQTKRIKDMLNKANSEKKNQPQGNQVHKVNIPNVDTDNEVPKPSNLLKKFDGPNTNLDN